MCPFTLWGDQIFKGNEQARTLYTEEKYDESLSLIDSMSVLYSKTPLEYTVQDSISLQMNKSILLYRQGKLDSAYKVITSVEGNHPGRKSKIAYIAGNIKSHIGDTAMIKALSSLQGQSAMAQMGKSAIIKALEKVLKEYEQSRDFYISSLKSKPTFEDAKWNLELTLHKIKRVKDLISQLKPPKPSEFAKKVKAQAEQLVEKKQYQKALQLMQALVQQDSTAMAFQNFMGRLGNVVKIK